MKCALQIKTQEGHHGNVRAGGFKNHSLPGSNHGQPLATMNRTNIFGNLKSNRKLGGSRGALNEKKSACFSKKVLWPFCLPTYHPAFPSFIALCTPGVACWNEGGGNTDCMVKYSLWFCVLTCLVVLWENGKETFVCNGPLKMEHHSGWHLLKVFKNTH